MELRLLRLIRSIRLNCANSLHFRPHFSRYYHHRPSNYVWNIVHVKQIFIMYLYFDGRANLSQFIGNNSYIHSLASHIIQNTQNDNNSKQKAYESSLRFNAIIDFFLPGIGTQIQFTRIISQKIFCIATFNGGVYFFIRCFSETRKEKVNKNIFHLI